MPSAAILPNQTSPPKQHLVSVQWNEYLERTWQISNPIFFTIIHLASKVFC